MKKLLHERLRGINTQSQLKLLLGLDDYVYSLNEIFNAIADEIERYYIPRPRDNMGIPYIEGDTVWSTDPETESSATVLDVRQNDVIIRWEDEILSRCKPSDLQHDRPSPKVYDADGVEIKVGDTVWDKNDPNYPELKVKEISPNGSVVLVDSCGCMCARLHSSSLTHKEPDSLEKVSKDLKEWCERGGWNGKIADISDRLSVLIEREK